MTFAELFKMRSTDCTQLSEVPHQVTNAYDSAPFDVLHRNHMSLACRSLSFQYHQNRHEEKISQRRDCYRLEKAWDFLWFLLVYNYCSYENHARFGNLFSFSFVILLFMALHLSFLYENSLNS